MPIGAGKYDDMATYVQQQTQAKGVVVIVFDGNKGGGFSVQLTIDMLLKVPAMLRSMADQIDADMMPTKQ